MVDPTSPATERDASLDHAPKDMSPTRGTGATAVTADELTRMSAQPVAAMHVLRMVEDPRSSTADLAQVIESDPVLSARVMRLANSPYYGLSRKVSSASRAVVMLGFSTVRALAVSAAYGLVSEDAAMGPNDFWTHSLTTAVCTSVVARQLSGPVSDAFSAGLLHDMGTALLHRRDPAAVAALHGLPASLLLGAEIETFGTDHARAGAAALEMWRFPPSFVRAVATHHTPPAAVPEILGRAVIAGEALADALEGDGFAGSEPVVSPAEALDALGIPEHRIPRLQADAQSEVERLARTLG